ncbi:MAG: PhoH family protein [Candidatus Methylomirabilia bacterium]
MTVKENTVKGAEVLEGETDLAWLAGEGGDALRVIEEASAVHLGARGNKVHLEGAAADVERVRVFLRDLARLRERGFALQPVDIRHAARAFFRDGEEIAAIFQEVVLIAPNKRAVSPKSLNQLRYVQAIRANDLVLGIGPAGTGKTFLAMAMGVALLSQKKVSRIILTRPAVEAGERLGFLPGDLYDKIHPYLRPLYDALYHMVDPDRVAKLVERGTIEVAPLAYMRGRTLNDSFVILDEAQNSTTEQMKMFLTRLGFDSRAVITGDVTQIDLPSGKTSGLIEAAQVLREVPGVETVRFTERDVVRHELVQKIILAYERHAAQGRDARPGPPGPVDGGAAG